MKIRILFTFALLLFLLGCKKKSFDEFDFSYGNTFETDFSIKFNNSNDSVFIRENWSANDNNPRIKSPKSNTNYFSVLSNLQKKKLDSFIKEIQFKKYDSIYFENYEDGNHYRIYVKKNGEQKLISVHSNNSPKELDEFAFWIYELKKNLKLTETKKVLNFKSKIETPKPPEL